MKIDDTTKGINPTPEFFEDQHTGHFVQILPDTYLIKGAINDRGFDQGYALKKPNRDEYILIDVVELATKEAIESLVNNSKKILAILISGEKVLKDAYADLQTISEDAGGAAIYVHPGISIDENIETKELVSDDALLSSFDLEVYELFSKTGEVLIYSRRNDGMLFPGNSATGAAYDVDFQTFTREKLEVTSDDFELGKKWSEYDRSFSYFFPRKGKPAIELDSGRQETIQANLRKGV